MRFGVLTGGGDCPGLNAVIRAIVRKGIDVHGDTLVGFRDGWQGVLENECDELTIESTRGILPRGGTILGTTNRGNPFAYQVNTSEGKRDYSSRVIETFHLLGLDALVAIGGDHVETLDFITRSKLRFGDLFDAQGRPMHRLPERAVSVA